MSRTSVCRCHKWFKDGREEVRVNEMCGRERNARKSESAEKIRNFLSEAGPLSIMTIRIQFGFDVVTVR